MDESAFLLPTSHAKNRAGSVSFSEDSFILSHSEIVQSVMIATNFYSQMHYKFVKAGPMAVMFLIVSCTSDKVSGI